jgi:hypothetical protein
MKNRDKSTTFIINSYRTFTILKSFFNRLKISCNKKPRKTGASLLLVSKLINHTSMTINPVRN